MLCSFVVPKQQVLPQSDANFVSRYSVMMPEVLDGRVKDLWLLDVQDCQLGKLVNTLAKGKVVEDPKLAGDARYWTRS